MKGCYQIKRIPFWNAKNVSTKSVCVWPGIVSSLVFIYRCAFNSLWPTVQAISLSFCSICALAMKFWQGIKKKQTKNNRCHQKNMKEKKYDWMNLKRVAARGCQWLWQVKNMLASILERKFWGVESKFLHLLSTVASFVKSQCRALLTMRPQHLPLHM